MRVLISVWVWATAGMIILIWLPWLTLIYLATAPFDAGRYTVGRWFRRTAVVSVALNPLWTFRTSGVQIRDPRRPYVVVSNHESLADVFLIGLLPWEMKWLSKESLFHLPVMGWLMRLAGDVSVRRDDPESRAAAMAELRDWLRKRVSVMIFPEGTRSPTDELLPFHDGAFRLAIEAGVPVLPLALAGTRAAISKGSLLLGRAHAEVRVLEPVSTAGLTIADVPALRERVRRLITEARAELQRELARG
jgi:1-acyl-sn-glycerol-3-phosphate acyltransferase